MMPGIFSSTRGSALRCDGCGVPAVSPGIEGVPPATVRTPRLFRMSAICRSV
jgi:hypothetical protein